MTLTNLFPIVRQLSLADKLQLLRFLAEELVSEEFDELASTQPPRSLNYPQARSRNWQQWCDRYATSSVGLSDAALSRDSIYSDR